LQHKVDTLRRCVHALEAQSVIAFMNHTRQLKDAVFKLEARGMNAFRLLIVDKYTTLMYQYIFAKKFMIKSVKNKVITQCI
jgi:hypothetical protein